jgi:hypothetical protein
LFPGAPVPVSLTHRLTLLIAWLFFHALLWCYCTPAPL